MHSPPVTRPFPPPSLSHVPHEYIVDQLRSLASHYWDRPQTADCTISKSHCFYQRPVLISSLVVPVPHHRPRPPHDSPLTSSDSSPEPSPRRKEPTIHAAPRIKLRVSHFIDQRRTVLIIPSCIWTTSLHTLHYYEVSSAVHHPVTSFTLAPPNPDILPYTFQKAVFPHSSLHRHHTPHSSSPFLIHLPSISFFTGCTLDRRHLWRTV